MRRHDLVHSFANAQCCPRPSAAIGRPLDKPDPLGYGIGGDCSICMSDLAGPPQDNPDGVVENREKYQLEACGHQFHEYCINSYVDTIPGRQTPECPVCKVPMVSEDVRYMRRQPNSHLSDEKWAEVSKRLHGAAKGGHPPRPPPEDQRLTDAWAELEILRASDAQLREMVKGEDELRRIIRQLIEENAAIGIERDVAVGKSNAVRPSEGIARLQQQLFDERSQASSNYEEMLADLRASKEANDVLRKTVAARDEKLARLNERLQAARSQLVSLQSL
mgnify:CR=1 FL=1